MIKYAVSLGDGKFIHMNPIKNNISEPLNTTDKLEKAKMWEKEGMCKTWLKKDYHKKMVERDGYTPEIIEIQIDYKVKEEECEYCNGDGWRSSEGITDYCIFCNPSGSNQHRC